MSTAENGVLALGDRNRLYLLRLILERPHSVSDLTTISGLGQSLVSHHLAVLVRSGWLTCRREGRRRLYAVALDGSTLPPLGRWIRRRIVLPAGWKERILPSASLADDIVDKKEGRESTDLEDYLL
jgi:DNA-binding transcriptional ArsR family regulator